MTYQEFIDYNRTKDQGPYTQKHHIIPLSEGGPDDESNIIELSWLTHYYAHYLLAKENPDNKKIQANWKRKGDIDKWLHWCYSSWDRKGEKNPNYGNPSGYRPIVTDEHRKRLSESHKGYVMPEEQKRKISDALKGKKKPKFTEEHRKNISISHKGKPNPKNSEHLKGRHLSEEQKKKIAEGVRRACAERKKNDSDKSEAI